MPVIDPSETITEAGTYTVNASLINERAGIRATSIVIRKDVDIIGSGNESPASAEIELSAGESGTFTVAVTGTDSIGRSYTQSRMYSFDIAAVAPSGVLFAVTFWESAETDECVKVLDAATLTVIPDSPEIPHKGLFCKFSPDGDYLAIAYLDESGETAAAKWAIYDTETWEAETITQPTGANCELAYIDWSADGRYVAGFFGHVYCVMDRDDEWSTIQLDDTFSSTGTGNTNAFLFVGNAELWALLHSGPIKRFSLFDTTISLPIVDTLTSINGHTLAKPWCGSVRLAEAETALDDAEVALIVDTEDDSVFANRLFVINPDGTVLHHENIASTNLILPQVHYSHDGTELSFTHTHSDSEIQFRDATDAYSSKTPLTLAPKKAFDYAGSLSALLIATDPDDGDLAARRLSDSDKTLELQGPAVINTLDFLTAASTSDRPANGFLQPEFIVPLTSWWRLEEESGSAAADYYAQDEGIIVSGNGHSWGAGHKNGGLILPNGSSASYLRTTNEYPTLSNKTVGFWYKFTNYASPFFQQILIAGPGYGDDSIFRVIYSYQLAQIRFEGLRSITAATQWGYPELEQWYHLALVWEHTGGTTVNVKFYRDGVLQGSPLPESGFSETNEKPFYFGGRTDGDGLNGAIDEIFYVDRALTQAQILKIMALT